MEERAPPAAGTFFFLFFDVTLRRILRTPFWVSNVRTPRPPGGRSRVLYSREREGGQTHTLVCVRGTHTHTREKLWSWLYPARSSRVLVWLTASRRHCQRPRESPQAVFPDRTWALRRAAGFSLVCAIPRSAPAARLSSGCVSAHLRAGRHMLCSPTCTPTRGPSGRRAVTLGRAAGAPAVERIATTLLTQVCAHLPL